MMNIKQIKTKYKSLDKRITQWETKNKNKINEYIIFICVIVVQFFIVFFCVELYFYWKGLIGMEDLVPWIIIIFAYIILANYLAQSSEKKHLKKGSVIDE